MSNSFTSKAAGGGGSAARRNSPEAGDPAPDATLTDTEGNKVTLSSFWTKKATLFVFLRHFGCPFCRQQTAALRTDYQKFQDAGAEVVCIGQGPYKSGKAFSVYFDLNFPVLVCEDDLSVYSRYGLDKGTFKELMGWGVIVRGVAALKHGIGKVEGDPMQMPGAFIVDTNGTVLFAHRPIDQSDQISMQKTLEVLEQFRIKANHELTA